MGGIATANIKKVDNKGVVYEPLVGDVQITSGSVIPGETVTTDEGEYLIICAFASICSDKPNKCLGCGNIYCTKKSE